MGILEKVRASFGLWMERIGLLGLPMGVGALIGFYVADQEMRLVPEFLSIILVALCFCLLAIVLGRLFAKKLYRETQQLINDNYYFPSTTIKIPEFYHEY